MQPFQMLHRTRAVRPITTVLLLTALAAPALARQDDASTATTPADDPSPLEWTLAPFLRYSFGAGLDRSNGDVSIWRAGLDANLAIPLSENAKIELGLGYEFSRYDFDRPNTFIAGTTEPFDDIQILDFSATAFVQQEPSWNWFVGASGQIAGDSSADVSDSGTFGGRAGIGFNPAENVELRLGVYVSSQIEDDELILPIFNVDWTINDEWRLTVAGTHGELIYQTDDALEFAVGGGWENRRFRLDDGAPQLGAVVEDTSIPVYGRIGILPDDSTRIDVIAGVMLSQEFEVLDRNGNNGTTFEADPAPFVGFAVQWTF